MTKPLNSRDRDHLNRLVRLKRQKTEQDFRRAQASLQAIEAELLVLQDKISRAQDTQFGFDAGSLHYQALHLRRLLQTVEMSEALRSERRLDFDRTRTALAKTLLALEHLSGS